MSVNVGGGGNQYLYNCYRLTLSKIENTWTGDPTITIDCTGLSTMQNMCDGGGTNPGYKKIVLKNVPTSPIVLSSLFYNHGRSSAFEFVELDGNLIGSGNCSSIISSNSSLKAITGGAFDLSGTTNITGFAKFAYALETVYFVPSTIKVDINFQGAARLTDESLVSAANGLDATASGHSITLDSTPKARCQTLMGTVADGLFTADASGTVSLTDFITTVKGWTLA